MIKKNQVKLFTLPSGESFAAGQTGQYLFWNSENDQVQG